MDNLEILKSNRDKSELAADLAIVDNKPVVPIEVFRANTIHPIAPVVSGMIKCNKCNRMKIEADFRDSNKIWKRCNECRTKYSKKNQNVQIAPSIPPQQQAPVQPTPFDNRSVTNVILPSKPITNIDPAKIQSTSIFTADGIRWMEKTLQMKVTSIEELDVMKPEERNKYAAELNRAYAEKLIGRINPLSYSILAGMKITEDTAPYVANEFGYDMKMTGMSKNLYDQKESLDVICNEILVDSPQIEAFVGPLPRLAMLLGGVCAKSVIENGGIKKKLD
jgi:hypothetical protein